MALIRYLCNGLHCYLCMFRHKPTFEGIALRDCEENSCGWCVPAFGEVFEAEQGQAKDEVNTNRKKT